MAALENLRKSISSKKRNETKSSNRKKHLLKPKVNVKHVNTIKAKTFKNRPPNYKGYSLATQFNDPALKSSRQWEK